MVVCARDDGSYEVIDGQQRLTTFWIFFCALREYFRFSKVPIPQDLHAKIAAMKTNERGEEEAGFRIGLHYMEGQGILRIFSDPSEFKDYRIATKSRSIDNLNSAYYTISEFLRDTFSERLDEVRKFYGYLCHRVKIIRVQTGTVSRALKIFETINDRGIGLDSMDLLKNLLFIKAKPEIFEQLRGSAQALEGAWCLRVTVSVPELRPNDGCYSALASGGEDPAIAQLSDCRGGASKQPV
jgi:uncharacterized protein with ParB-like and HNH nuclease domain